MQSALPYLCKGTVETPIFMQDNAPGYKAKTVLSFLKEEGIAVIKWPLQSPHMNPIENVWKIIGEKAQNRNPVCQWSRRPGFNPRSSHTKDFKNGT